MAETKSQASVSFTDQHLHKNTQKMMHIISVNNEAFLVFFISHLKTIVSDKKKKATLPPPPKKKKKKKKNKNKCPWRRTKIKTQHPTNTPQSSHKSHTKHSDGLIRIKEGEGVGCMNSKLLHVPLGFNMSKGFPRL